MNNRAGLFASLALLMVLASNSFAQNDFRINPSTGGLSSQIRPAPDYVNTRILAAGVSETFTVPGGIRWMLFSANCDFFAKKGATAAVPGADVTDGTGSELNPSAWFIERVAQVSVISVGTCIVTGAFYR